MSADIKPINGHHTNEFAASAQPPSLFRAVPIDEADARMQRTLSKYKSVMVNNNRNLIIDLVNKVNALEGHSKKHKLDLMARFWYHRSKWHDLDAGDWRYCPPGVDLNEIRAREAAVRNVKQLRTLQHPYMNGLIPSILDSDADVELVLSLVKEVATEHAAHLAENSLAANHESLPPDLSLPAEMLYFHKYTVGIRDPDFRCEDMCQWSLLEDLDLDHAKNPVAHRHDIKNYIQDLLITHDLPVFVTDQLDVMVGFGAGSSQRPMEDSRVWESYYLFCRDVQPPVSGNASGWAWRIVFVCRSDQTRHPNNHLPVFDNIAEVLEWYTR